MMNVVRRLMNDGSGSTTVLFSLCLVVILIACGAAVDFVRWEDAKTQASAIADTAALSAVSDASGNEAKMKAIAAKYVQENTAALAFAITGNPTYSYDPKTAEFTVEINGRMRTSLMMLAGISDIEVNARSVALRPLIPPVEMVLALDTTGSMAGSKIAALKAAAGNMVTSVLKNKDARIGIVPFANYVNVGVGRRHDAFFDVPEDYSKQVDSCSTTYPDKKDCSTVKTTGTCTSTNDGVTTTYSCTSSKEVCSSWGQAVKSCKKATQTYKFTGCVGSREEAYRVRIDVEAKKYPGFLNTSCSEEILDLTNNLGKAKSKIASLAASGETYLPNGLIWGWNMLASPEPLTAALPADELAARGGMKVLVLMTDGQTTLAPSTKSAATHVGPASSVYKSVSYSDALSAQLCARIKQDGIEIYTVQYDVVDKALEKLLTDCASARTKPIRPRTRANWKWRSTRS